ncbi:hypothetical protein LCGC14_2550340 [marine sediment metagenome]|uniref:Uncharacterized protein n=1 Tax=marine sediment metagenome TaxID=412755 RepID=A0A0F9DG62_9ZZZZ
MKYKIGDRVDCATYEVSMTFAGILSFEERDEIDKLRYDLHTKMYQYTRKNMNLLENVTRDICIFTKNINKEKEDGD